MQGPVEDAAGDSAKMLKVPPHETQKKLLLAEQHQPHTCNVTILNQRVSSAVDHSIK